MLFIYTTCATKGEAEKLGKLVINKKMGACVDYWPIESMYNWKGEFKQIEQAMLLVTTFESKLDEVTDLLSAHHSYSTPLIAGVDVRRINRAYKEWMTQEVV
jgi:periplasmic divalent cation tolerance protein